MSGGWGDVVLFDHRTTDLSGLVALTPRCYEHRQAWRPGLPYEAHWHDLGFGVVCSTGL